MNVHSSRAVKLAILFLLAVGSGCAQQKLSVREASQADVKGFATLKDIQVSADASSIKVVADMPLVYTFYKTSEPPQAFIDLSQTDPGGFTSPLQLNNGNFKSVTVSRHDYGPGIFTRLEVSLFKDTELQVKPDATDKKVLFIRLPDPDTGNTATSEQAKEREADQPQAAEAAKAAPAVSSPAPAESELAVQTENKLAATSERPTAQTATAEQPATIAVAEASSIQEPPKTKVDQPEASKVEGEAVSSPNQTQATGGNLPVAEPSTQDSPPAKGYAAPVTERLVTAINAGTNRVEVIVEGGVESYNLFSMNKPNRLIMDIIGARSAVKEKSVPIDKFGLSNARIGVTPEKVRVVFDAPGEIVRPFRAEKTAKGLAVIFGVTEETLPLSEPMASVAEQAVPATDVLAAGQAVEKNATSLSDSKADAAGARGETATAKAGDGVAPGSLRDLRTVTDGIEIVINGGYREHRAFLLDKPQRLAIDLYGVANEMPSRTISIGALGIQKARVGVSGEKVRIVLDASGEKIPPHKIVSHGTGLKVVLDGTATATTAAAAPVDPKTYRTATASQPISPVPADAGVEKIDFEVIGDSSRISLKVKGDCRLSEPKRTRDGLTLILKKCQLPKKLQRMLDTSSFQSVVTAVTPYSVKTRSGFDTRVLAKVRADAPSTVKQEGDQILWDIKNTKVPEPKQTKPEQVPPPRQKVLPPVEAQEAELLEKPEEPAVKVADPAVQAERKRYTGRRVTLEFSDADIRKIFQLIAEVSGYNFLIADDVSGTISLKLVNVPWDQALDVIMETKGLAMKRDGNIVQIKPKSKIKTQEQEELEAEKLRDRMMKLETYVFEVSYAAIGDVASQFRTIASDRGKEQIILDARTNKVIVTDIEPKLQKMKELLKTLDVAEKQVMIEARIVEATTTFARDMGVQWGLNFVDGSGSLAGMTALSTSFGGVVSNVLPSGNTGGIATGMSFGKLASNIQLDLKLSAAATTGLIKIISTPKVVTLNNKAAKISQGQSIPYQSTSAEGTKTEFVEAALTLEVTPHITADGFIGMKIKASNNSPGAGAPPPINKKEATTELQVRNGETTVIGGIYVDSDTESDTGVPFLKDIPLLGWLFKSSGRAKTKTELLIFITPKILS